jgi:uncharacterized membrane protein
MKMATFYHELDEARIVQAIAQAETQTSGEIRVFVSNGTAEDPVEQAKAHFLKLEMDQTRERNAVLIFFAPRSQQFALVGDTAIHARCGEAFWQTLTAAMKEHLAQNHFTDAVVLAVEKCGALLTEHFPRGDDNANELPNEIIRD